MKHVTISLRINVSYSMGDGNDIPEAQLRQLHRNLDYLPEYAAGMGAFTEDTECVVDTWGSDVTMTHSDQPAS